MCLVAGKALALTAAPEKPWKPDPALIQKLAQTKAEDIETGFGRLIPESERLPYATALAGFCFWQLKDEQRTERYLKLALGELHGLEPEKYAGEVYMLSMLLAERRNDLAALVKYGESIEPAITKDGPIPPLTRTIILQLLARAEYKIGDFRAAVKWARRMVDESDKTTLPALQGEAYFVLAEANYKSGDFDGAADAANRARERYAQLGDESGLGHCEKVLGNAEMGRGTHNAEAGDHYRKAIEHYTHVRDEHGLGNCYFNLGAMAKGERKWPEAIKALEEAVFHFVSSGSPGGAGMAKTQLGAVLSETNELPKARVVLEEAKTLLVRDNAPNRLAELDFILGKLYEKLNESRAAKQAYQEALQLYRKANDTEAMKPVQEALARTERADGR